MLKYSLVRAFTALVCQNGPGHEEQNMDTTTILDAYKNISLNNIENTSLFGNNSVSLNFTKQEAGGGGADLPTLASKYITYKIGKLCNFYNTLRINPLFNLVLE